MPTLAPRAARAARVLSRRAVREQNDRVEQAERDGTADGDNESPEEKAPPEPRVRKRSAKLPPRMFARWAVCDNGLERVAVFGYRDRDGTDAKLAEVPGRKPGVYFLQLIKVALDPPAPASAGAAAVV